jgi:hypothetical protein
MPMFTRPIGESGLKFTGKGSGQRLQKGLRGLAGRAARACDSGVDPAGVRFAQKVNASSACQPRPKDAPDVPGIGARLDAVLHELVDPRSTTAQ